VDLGSVTGTDCTNAAAAWRALWFSMHTYMPSSVEVSLGGNCEVKDSATGAPIAELGVGGSPAAVTGLSTAHYAAGTGIRVQWNTSTVRNRRLMRGATHFIPLTADAMTALGTVDNTAASTLNTACGTYLTAMNAAALVHGVWHRPAKGTFTGGVLAPCTAGVVDLVVSSLRTRRT
jgi:hypothetical protein